MFTQFMNKIIKHCTGNLNRVTTFEKLVYVGENLIDARKIADSCNTFRWAGYNDNAVVQCCAKGFVEAEDLTRMIESHAGLVKHPGALRRYLCKNTPKRMLWADFKTHIRYLE